MYFHIISLSVFDCNLTEIKCLLPRRKTYRLYRLMVHLAQVYANTCVENLRSGNTKSRKISSIAEECELRGKVRVEIFPMGGSYY